ncbi:MAG: ribosome-associated translation inhibitor RaiA [bacterium]|nr:ribosome-associated translation inhibitor RaiA [bacterium]
MKISVSGHHYHLSDATREYVEQECEKFERFYSPVLDCQVTISKEGRTEKANVVVNLYGQNLQASGSADKLYPAIDQAMDKMIRQLKKTHDKRRKPRPRSPLVDSESEK